MAQDWSLLGKIAKSDQSWAICCNNFSVNQPLLKYESRYLLEIFSICSSHVNAKLTKKILPLLNQAASHSRYRPKLWRALGTLFVETFYRVGHSESKRPFGQANHPLLTLKSSNSFIRALSQSHLIWPYQIFLAQPSIWPQKRPLSKSCQKYIEPIVVKF